MELDITGARILWETPINVPILGQLKISETMVVSWLVMLLITNDGALAHRLLSPGHHVAFLPLKTLI